MTDRQTKLQLSTKSPVSPHDLIDDDENADRNGDAIRELLTATTKLMKTPYANSFIRCMQDTIELHSLLLQLNSSKAIPEKLTPEDIKRSTHGRGENHRYELDEATATPRNKRDGSNGTNIDEVNDNESNGCEMSDGNDEKSTEINSNGNMDIGTSDSGPGPTFDPGEDTYGKVMGNAPVVIQDKEGEPQAFRSTVDTGTGYSLIQASAVEDLNLVKMPLPPTKMIELETPTGEKVKATEFVRLKIKSGKIGLWEFVTSDILVFEGGAGTAGTDIWLGHRFLAKHKVLQHILAQPQFDARGNPFHALKDSRSAAQKKADEAAKMKARKTAEDLDRIRAAAHGRTDTMTNDSSSTTGSWDNISELRSEGCSSSTSWTQESKK